MVTQLYADVLLFKYRGIYRNKLIENYQLPARSVKLEFSQKYWNKKRISKVAGVCTPPRSYNDSNSSKTDI